MDKQLRDLQGNADTMDTYTVWLKSQQKSLREFTETIRQLQSCQDRFTTQSIALAVEVSSQAPVADTPATVAGLATAKSTRHCVDRNNTIDRRDTAC